MTVLSIETEDKKIINAVKALLKVKGVAFSENKKFNQNLYNKILKARQDDKKGKLFEVNPDNIWENIE